jgi:hypothetical protein
VPPKKHKKSNNPPPPPLNPDDIVVPPLDIDSLHKKQEEQDPQAHAQQEQMRRSMINIMKNKVSRAQLRKNRDIEVPLVAFDNDQLARYDA